MTMTKKNYFIYPLLHSANISNYLFFVVILLDTARLCVSSCYLSTRAVSCHIAVCGKWASCISTTVRSKEGKNVEKKVA